MFKSQNWPRAGEAREAIAIVPLIVERAIIKYSS